MSKTTFGNTKIAKICHVTPHSVWRWIEEGKLPSFSTGGGHRRVWAQDLVIFLKEHNIPVPQELLDDDLPRILIVDDEPETRSLIKRVVRKLYPVVEIHEAADGFEAGHKVADLLPSLVVLDLRLPGMNGIKVCRTIRSNSKLRGIKILAMTAYSIEESKKRIMEAGADDFLAKPFDTGELAGKVQKLLSVVMRK